MSWLAKVSNLAEKAEDLLNQFDSTAGSAIQKTKARSSTPNPTRSNSYAQLKPEEVNYTEELGRSGPSLPSRTHSEFTGRRKYGDNFVGNAPSTSAVAEREKMDESLFSMLNEDSISVINEVEGRSRRSSGRSIASVQTTQSEMPDHWKSQLWAKDSQINSMKSKLADLERRLEKRHQDYYELKAEKDMLQSKLSENANSDNIEELKLARRKIQEQKDLLMDECNQMKKQNNALEEEVRAISDQLRLAKFNLNENKKEFDEYKEKAQKILHAKEKLVESLKSEQGVGGVSDRPAHLIQAEMEELRVERDLSRADLEAAQLQLYNLRSEMEELENLLREERSKQSELRRQQLEEKHTWQSTISLLNEKVDCARIESDFSKTELKRQSDDFNRRLESKEHELRKAIEEQRSRRREEEYYHGDANVGERLLQKQVELEEALRNNNILSLRLERLQKDQRETVIPIEPSSSIQVQNPTVKNAVGLIDTISFKFISMLRNYPASRIFAVVYFVVLHFWVFFIILTYTPEIHDHNSPLPTP